MTPASDAEPLVGRVVVNEGDAAVLLHVARARAGYFNQPRLLFYGVAAAFVAALLALAGHRHLAEALLALAAALAVLSLLASTRTAATLRHGSARGQEREIEVGDDGVAVREPEMRLFAAWPRIERALEGRDHLVLVAGPAAIVIPRRAFTPDAYVRAREHVAARVRIERLTY